MNITLEILILGHMKRFFENGFMASGLQDPSLMEGQGTETASAEAARLLTRLNLISSIAGTPPRAL